MEIIIKLLTLILTGKNNKGTCSILLEFIFNINSIKVYLNGTYDSMREEKFIKNDFLFDYFNNNINWQFT